MALLVVQFCITGTLDQTCTRGQSGPPALFIGQTYSHMKLMEHVLVTSLQGSPPFLFPRRFIGDSAGGMLLVAFLSRWSRAPSVSWAGRRLSPGGSPAICSASFLSSQITKWSLVFNALGVTALFPSAFLHCRCIKKTKKSGQVK